MASSKKLPAKSGNSSGKSSKSSRQPKVAESQYTWKAGENKKPAMKAGADARTRAAKYGKVTKDTTFVTSGPREGINGRVVEAQTTVKSSRGNPFLVTEAKYQRKNFPDGPRKTTVKSLLPDYKLKKSAPKTKKEVTNSPLGYE